MDATVWTDMFHPGLPIFEKVARPVLVYVFLVLGLRLAGKRELAQLNPFDLIVLMTLSNTVQNAIIGNDNSVTGGLIGAATLLALNYGVVRFLYRHQTLDRIVEGDADILVEDGHLREDRLEKELITRAELETAARKQGLGSLDEVERAVLEAGGSISFVAKKPSAEASRHSELLARLEEIKAQVASLRGTAPLTGT